MEHGIGRSPDRGANLDPILERRPGQHVGQRRAGIDQLDDAVTGAVRHCLAPRVDPGDRAVIAQRQAHCLEYARQRRRCAHRHAGAWATAHAGFGRHEVGIRHRSGADLLAEPPDVGAAADVVAPKLAVEHRPGADQHRRQTDRRRAHQHRRRVLVATAEQDDAVHRIAADRFLDIHTHQVAKQHRRRADLCFAQAHRRELERDAACFPHAALDPLGNVAEMAVAWVEFGKRLTDADDRLAVENVIGQPLRLHPAPVDKAVTVTLAVRRGGTKFRLGGVGHKHSNVRYELWARGRDDHPAFAITVISLSR